MSITMAITYQQTAERWDVFEVTITGPDQGNPFTEQTVTGIFSCAQGSVKVSGFYDGDGRYLVRFMPSFEGRHSFEITASFLDRPECGTFTVQAAKPGNHGPVRVHQQYHFAYEDGTPYYPVGTTCYVWNLQSDALIEQTLASMAESGFNKLRFCVFPKHYVYNLHEPRSYPYEGTPMDSSVLTVDNFNSYNGAAPGNDWKFDRFNPAHFRHIEECIRRLCRIGVEADIIIMHPYDRWGFSCMTQEQNELYWHYLVARLSAFRNVWWSLANEYDLIPAMQTKDWERLADILCQEDHVRHLRSIHNCMLFYDHNRPWVTHCSIQRQDLYKTAELTDEWRERYHKPVVLDEIAYEGNIQHGWGNITGEEMVRRFWEAACRGGYPGHGETYLSPDGILWWSHGGPFHGESWKRVKFLLKILSETPGGGLVSSKVNWDDVSCVPQNPVLAGQTGYRIYYYSFMRPSFREFAFKDDVPRHVEVIDTWNMTVEDAGIHIGSFRIPLPARPYMAIRVTKA